MRDDVSPRLIDLALEPAFALAGLEVRPASLEVLAGERREQLEPRIMQVLVALAGRRGEVVSRDELIQRCWGGRVVGDDSISRCIFRLRKLADSLGGFEIVTVPRVGFRLQVETVIASATGPALVVAAHRLAVLPFDNLSADPELSYFSDGVAEEILNTLTRARDLEVISRGSSFQFRGSAKAVSRVAAELSATHLLDGSVRRGGVRVRISARLVECASDTTLWSERFDRELSDVFAVQEEIADAIVGSLKATLTPEAKETVARRGTDNPAAYDLYLMARHGYVAGDQGDPHWAQAIIRLSQRATEIDPSYASAWALLATGQVAARYMDGEIEERGLAAADRALALDPGLAEAYAVKARILSDSGQHAAAAAEIQIALRQDQESWQVNYTAGLVFYFHTPRRLDEAVRYFDKAAALNATDLVSPAFLYTCNTLTGDRAAALRAAELSVAHAEKVLAEERNNSFAMSVAADSLAVLGESQRARELIERALLLDPDNFVARHQIAGTLAATFNEPEAAVDVLVPAIAKMSRNYVDLMNATPKLDSIRNHPRVTAAVAEARVRWSRRTVS